MSLVGWDTCLSSGWRATRLGGGREGSARACLGAVDVAEGADDDVVGCGVDDEEEVGVVEAFVAMVTGLVMVLVVAREVEEALVDEAGGCTGTVCIEALMPEDVLFS